MRFSLLFNTAVAACLIMVMGSRVRAQQGEGKMKCVAVGMKNNVWAVNQQDRVFHWNGSSWDEPSPNARLKQISVGADGFSVWGVNNGDAIWALSGESNGVTTWTQIPGGLKHVSVGSSRVIWGVSSDDQIWNYQGSWVSIPGGLCQIDAASDGTVWGVSKDEKIWRRDGNTWTNIPGGLIHVSVGSADQVWGVSKDDKIWHRVNNTWVQVEGGLKQIDVAADGSVWGVNSANQVWQYTGSGWKEIVPASAKQIDWSSIGTNVALGKFCSQSSRSEWSASEQGAVDGVKNGSFGFHTNDEINPWWQVDLGARKKLSNVVIFNRQDCCSERARTIRVLVSEDGMNFTNVYSHDGSIFGGVTDGKPLNVALKDVVARYVRLQLNESNLFQLDEVEVYGKEVPQQAFSGMGEQKVTTSGITFYEHGGFTGASKTIASDWDFSSSPEWNDRISSIRIPNGYKIQVFEHGQFGGASRILTADWSVAENSPQAFNDIISSIKILSYPAHSR